MCDPSHQNRPVVGKWSFAFIIMKAVEKKIQRIRQFGP